MINNTYYFFKLNKNYFLILLLFLFLLSCSKKFYIDPIYLDARDFSEELAAVKVKTEKGPLWGFIDKEGKTVIKPEYDEARYFSEGLAAINSGGVGIGKWGFIDKAGKVIIEAKYEYVGDFHEGLALVLVGDKIGYIDKTGKVEIEPIFSKGWSDLAFNKENLSEKYYENDRKERDFSNGFAVVNKAAKGYEFPLPIYINSNGQLLFDNSTDHKTSFFKLYKFSEDVAIGIQLNPKIYTIITKDGSFSKLIDDDDKTYMNGYFHDGLASVSVNKKYGYLNKNGKIIISPKYYRAFDFSEGVAVVFLDSELRKSFFIDTDGKILYEFDQGEARKEYLAGILTTLNFKGNFLGSKSYNFSEGLLPVFKADIIYNRMDKNKKVEIKYGMIDKYGKLIVDYTYNQIGECEVDIDIDGDKVCLGSSGFHNGMAVVKENNLYGYIKNTYSK